MNRRGTIAGLDLEAAGVFVLIWWLAGISPGFISVPAASLGHTIIAQSATYVLAALPVLIIGRFAYRRFGKRMNQRTFRLAIAALALLLLAIVAWRDLPDYYIAWPERGMTRFLYRADIRDLAHYVNNHLEMTDFGVGGFLAGPWDRLAFSTDLNDPVAVRARWFNPERVTLLTTGEKPALAFRSQVPGPAVDESSYIPLNDIAGSAFALFEVGDQPSTNPGMPLLEEAICFQNGLCAQQAVYEASSGRLSVTWAVSHPLNVPEQPLISNPPPPNVYAGPRLLVFAQLVDDEGHFLTGDDGLWIDTSALWPGDRFRQVHYLPAPDSGLDHVIVFGLYDPMTGQRIATVDGRDQVAVPISTGNEG